MTEKILDTRHDWCQLRAGVHRLEPFDKAAIRWRRETSTRAEKLLSRFSKIEPRAAELLQEEAQASSLDLPGGTGGWGAVALTPSPLVVLVGQNPYLMPLIPEPGTSFSTLTPSDRYFLWLLANSCRVLGGAQESLTFDDWTNFHSVPASKEWTAPEGFLEEMSCGRIVNFEAVRYYELVDDELRLSSAKTKGLVHDHFQNVVDAGHAMLGSLLQAGSSSHPQAVIALGSWTTKSPFLGNLLEPVSTGEDSSHLLIDTFHPAARGEYITNRESTYVGISELIRNLVGCSRRRIVNS